MFIVQVLLEIAIVLLIAYGIWHEEELIKAEVIIKKFIINKFKECRK